MSAQSAATPLDARTAVSPNGSARLLTADELADRWQVGKAHIYRLTREGLLPCVRIGRYYRYRVASIEAFESAGGVAADE